MFVQAAANGTHLSRNFMFFYGCDVTPKSDFRWQMKCRVRTAEKITGLGPPPHLPSGHIQHKHSPQSTLHSKGLHPLLTPSPGIWEEAEEWLRKDQQTERQLHPSGLLHCLPALPPLPFLSPASTNSGLPLALWTTTLYPTLVPCTTNSWLYHTNLFTSTSHFHHGHLPLSSLTTATF